jgi:hypothetical protein
MKVFKSTSPYQGDAFLLEQVRDLLYLLVTQADVERNRGEWPELKAFQAKYMLDTVST